LTSVIFCTPTIKLPYPEYIEAMERSVPALDAAGIEHQLVLEVGSVYISWARANMLMKAMKTDADAFVFIDHDMSWKPDDLLNLIQQSGDVVAGTYRYKQDDVEYMGKWATDADNRPTVREDGTLIGYSIPAGFLKVTRTAVEKFTAAYPELTFGPEREYIDLFNHGAHDGLWWGEDFAFARRWRDLGEEVVLIPDLNLTHHLSDGRAFPGNLHEFLMAQPGGSKHDLCDQS
jgi:hypothetical protein